jgi:hypothetical protein
MFPFSFWIALLESSTMALVFPLPFFPHYDFDSCASSPLHHRSLLAKALLSLEYYIFPLPSITIFRPRPYPAETFFCSFSRPVRTRVFREGRTYFFL